jgi:hypothetical protein
VTVAAWHNALFIVQVHKAGNPSFWSGSKFQQDLRHVSWCPCGYYSAWLSVYLHGMDLSVCLSACERLARPPLPAAEFIGLSVRPHTTRRTTWPG